MLKISETKKALCMLLVVLITALAPSQACAQWVWSGKAAAPSRAGKGKYDKPLAEAFDYYEKRQYGRAYKKFKSISKKKRDNPYRETAIFMAGQSLYMKKDYDGALKYFEKIVRDNPASAFMKEALESEYEIACKFQKMKGGLFFGDRRRRAIKLCERIIKRAPYGKLQADAQLAMADTYFDLSAYFDAQHAYEAFIELYKDDPRLRYAELNRSLCLLKQARGPNYDPVPFIETRETLGPLLAREKDDEKKAHYRKLYDESIDALAQKDYSIGEYYLRTGDPDAALFYFKSVAKRYPDTEWAAHSQKRIEGITRTQSEKSGKKKIFFFPARSKENDR